tara:strand:+ start:699 stop:1082 length:384 start_codon:yes stop_codon:yes gene_type:complete
MNKLLPLIISLLLVMSNTLQATTFTISCWDGDNRFLQNHRVDTKNKSIKHIYSRDYNIDIRWEESKLDDLKIINWDYPIVYGYHQKNNKYPTLTFKYFDFEKGYLSQSAHFDSMKKPRSMLFECQYE